MRYPCQIPRFTWFKFSNFNITCDIPKYPKDHHGIYTGFRDTWQDIPDPSLAQSAHDPHYEENMDASYCQTSLGGDGVSHQQFLQLLEKQDKKGFNDLATLLSLCHSCPCLHKGLPAPYLWPRLWRLVFSQHWTVDKDKADMFTPCETLSCAFTNTLRTTGYSPWISWVIPVYLVMSFVNTWHQM